MIYCQRTEKSLQNLWHYYLLFRCCVIVIPIYIILIICGSYAMANNLEVPTIIGTLYEFLLLVFSAAIVFIIVLFLATFSSNPNKMSGNDSEYESEVIDSTNETTFEEEFTLTIAEESLLTGLERATDQIELLFDNCSEFVVDLIPFEEKYSSTDLMGRYDLPPTYEEAIRSDNRPLNGPHHSTQLS